LSFLLYTNAYHKDDEIRNITAGLDDCSILDSYDYLSPPYKRYFDTHHRPF
jgi:hypothetical protein